MKYYLTTPIYYVNAAPHIGHAYTTIVADLIKRFKRMQGYDAVLTTGSDEHGVNVERAAERAGKSPKEFCDAIAAEFARQWKSLGLDIDYFQRTTNANHARMVNDLFRRCMENGYIYKGSYTGQYCIFDNLFVNEAKPGDPCPDCGRPTETITEENFFFKLSAFQDRLLELYEREPLFMQPDTKRNEVLSFVKSGLTDLSITRTGIKWGIPVEGHPPHVFYVWFDALTTYMSAVEGKDLWPADLHLIGKEIVRFHAIYWPAFLMAAGLPLPKRIFAHGWLLFEESKMSKSRGNIVRAEPIKDVMGVDALRYFLLREVVFGQDGSFSYDALIGRYNSDLANGLGNLASRTLTMIHQYRKGVVPASDGDSEIAGLAAATIGTVQDLLDRFEYSRALEAVWMLISAVDKFIVTRAPWKLARATGPDAPALLDNTLYTAAEALRVVTALLYPVLPQSTPKIWAQLGMPEPIDTVKLDTLKWGGLKAGQTIGEVSAVFPRIEAKEAIAKMKQLEEEATAAQAVLMGKVPAAATEPEGVARIAIDDFLKVDLRVGQVLMAQNVKGSTKLMHMTVDIGEAQPRTIVAGIAEAYTPEQLLNRKIVIVANLQPRKLKGIESNGMIVAASVNDGKPVLAGFHEDIPVGAAEVKLVDSHCHLDDPKFDEDREQAIERARAAGVERLLAIGTGNGPPDLEAALRLAGRYDFIYATIGVHPHDAAKATEETFARLRELAAHPKVIAIGEVGLDYHYDFSPRPVQRDVFARQLELAAEARKPIVIHTREAWDDTLAQVTELPHGGIMHCFTGDAAQARQALDRGFHLAFGGVLTFPRAEDVREAARLTPDDRLLVETDCPYLAPVPHRGKRNEPAFLLETVRRLAEVRGRAPEEIAEITTRNFERLCTF